MRVPVPIPAVLPLLLPVLLALPCVARAENGVEPMEPRRILRDLKRYDPVEDLPRRYDAEMDRREEEATAETRRKYRGRSDWRVFIVDAVERKRANLKRRLLRERVRRYEAGLAALGAQDDRNAAKYLCAIFVALEQRAVEVDERHAGKQEALRAIYLRTNADLRAEQLSLDNDYRPEAMRLTGDIDVLEAFARHLVGLQMSCRRWLTAMSSDEALEHLGERELMRARHPRLRAVLAGLLSQGRKVPAELIAKAAARERDPGVRAKLAGALARYGEDAVPHLKTLLDLLEDRDETVRRAAAFALMQLHVAEAVGPLVERMEQEEGHTLDVFARALASLTGKRHGIFPDVWKRWWEANGARVLAEGLGPRGGARGPDAEGGGRDVHFYGIRQISRRIIYVLDISGSMKHKVGDGTRLDACRDEFKRAVGRLRRGATFNLVVYSTDVEVWSKKQPMRPKNEKTVAEVGSFVDGFQPKNSTNIFDALKTAFELAGAGASRKGGRLVADTIFLLTDGSPTTPDGKTADTGRILEGARLWNADGRVTIHTIGIGNNLNTSFLAALAREHGGQFIHKQDG